MVDFLKRSKPEGEKWQEDKEVRKSVEEEISNYYSCQTWKRRSWYNQVCLSAISSVNFQFPEIVFFF